MRRPIRSECRGVSLLLELLLGFSLVAIALLSVFRLFPSSERATMLADRKAQAHHIAVQLLESEMTKHYSALLVGVTEGEEPVRHTLRRGVEIETNFRYRIEVTRPYSGREIYNVSVSVTWDEGSADSPRAAPVRVEADKGRFW